MVKEKETFSCSHCDYTSGYKIAVIAHERKHKNEPKVEEPKAEPETKVAPPASRDEDLLEGPGEEVDTSVSSSSSAGRFS